MEVAWTTKKCSIGQRSLVCSRIDKGVEQNVGNWDEIINSILPTKKWADRMNKPRTWTVS